MRRLLFVLLLLAVPGAALAHVPRWCRDQQAALVTCHNQLMTCQSALSACQAGQVPVTTAPEIHLVTTATAAVATRITVPLLGEADWIIADIAADGSRYVKGDWLMTLIGPGTWDLIFTPFEELGLGRITLVVTRPDQVYRQPVAVEVR